MYFIYENYLVTVATYLSMKATNVQGEHKNTP